MPPNTSSPTTVGQAAATAPNGPAADNETIIGNASGCPTGSTGAKQRGGPLTPVGTPTPAAYAKADPAWLDNLPDTVKRYGLFCDWRLTPRPGSDKPAKVPYDPKTGQPAKPGDMSTFGTLDEALKALATGGYTGIGIAVVGTVGAIDIDHCINESGELSEMAQDIVTTMDAYTEVSPSGHGIRILFTVPVGFAFDMGRYYINSQSRHLEVYVAGATQKYVTVTGNTLTPGADLVERGDALTAVLERYMVRDKPLASTPVPAPVQAGGPPADPAAIQAADQQLLDEIAQTSSGPRLAALLAGDMTECGGDHSSADMTACNILAAHTTDAAQIDRIIRSSALMRPKWDRQQSGSTYGAITINKAIASAVQYRQAHGELTPEQVRSMFVQAAPQQGVVRALTASQPAQAAAPSASSAATLQIKYGSPISAADLQNMSFPPLVYLVEDLLPEGTSLLGGAPKTGKSWMLLHLCLALSMGTPFLGHMTAQCEVLYLALEDNLRRLQYRIRQILQGQPFPKGLYLQVASPGTADGLYILLDHFLAQNPNIKFVAIDTLVKVRKEQSSIKGIYQADYKEVSGLKDFADQHNISLMLVHHFNKREEDGDPMNSLSGSSGIPGAVDEVLILKKNERFKNEADLYISGRDIEQSTNTIRFDEDACVWEYIGSADEIDEQRAKADYANDELVLTIKKLIANSPDGTWEGTATDIRTAGQADRRLMGVSAQKIGKWISAIVDDLESADGIVHRTAGVNGSGGKKHYFYVSSCATSSDEDTGASEVETIGCRYDPDADADGE